MLVVVPTLGLGGVERALASVLKNLDRSRFAPQLCVLGSATGELVPPADVSVIALGRRSRWGFLLLVARLRRTIDDRRPDVVLTFSGTANLVALAAARKRRVHALVITEHIAPTHMYTSVEEPVGWLKRVLIRKLYPRADAVVAVSRGIADELVRDYGIDEDLVTVIHTPVEIDRLTELAQEEPAIWPVANPVVVSVGRLTPQKNHELLLEALRDVDCSAVIVGDGPERERLDGLAGNLGGRVVLVGEDSNPYRYVARADVFVLSSRFEGFGVVIVEALALGIPVVSTDCDFGPREILDHGRYGVLVESENAEALATALRALLSDPVRRQTLAASAPARAAEYEGARATSELEVVLERCYTRRQQLGRDSGVGTTC